VKRSTTPVAWLALFFALAGTGIAASHYIITSTKQISPSVRAQLRGHAGPPGPEGIQGKLGLQGLYGLPGPAGPTGPRGEDGRERGPTGPMGYRGESVEGPRGYRGCGQAPTVKWGEQYPYVQGCTDKFGEREWRYVRDPKDGKEYECTAGTLDEGPAGKYCTVKNPPSESPTEWSLRP